MPCSRSYISNKFLCKAHPNGLLLPIECQASISIIFKIQFKVSNSRKVDEMQIFRLLNQNTQVLTDPPIGHYKACKNITWAID